MLYKSMTDKYEKAFKAPINTSVSRHIHAFSKSNRFQSTPQSSCKKSFYNCREPREMRSTTFGFGNKVPVLNKEEGAPPGAYNPKSGFFLS